MGEHGKTAKSLTTVGAAIVTAAGLAYWWRRQAVVEPSCQPPGPPGLPLVGILPRARADQMRNFLRLRQQFGDVVRLQIGPRLLYLVSHPDYAQYVLQENNRNYTKGRGLDKTKPLLGEGLLTSEGEFWCSQRRLIQPAFHRRRIDGFAETMVTSTEEMLARWQGIETLDVTDAMMHLTLDIVTKTLFGTALSQEEIDTVSELMRPMLKHTTERITSLFDFTDEWPTPANRQQWQRLETLDRIVYRIIAERRRQTGRPGQPLPEDDLLGMLMSAQDEETGRAMTDRQLRDEVMTLFLAGHETTANLLSFTWYTLAHHGMVRRRLEKEVDEVLQGRRPTAADISNLAYTRMVIDEVLRLYPPAWIVGRQPQADDEIGGYPIPAGSSVLISIYNIQRHPDFWQNPEGFDPLRFTPEEKRERHRYAFLPFGGGPRLCIGNNFALTEAALVVALVTQRFRLNLVPGQEIEPEVAFTLRPAGPIYMELQPRKPAAVVH